MSAPSTSHSSTPESKGVHRSVSAVRAPLLQRACACAGGGECERCKKPNATATLQRASANPAQASPATAPPVVNRVLSSPGRPLDSGARSFMEPRFGHDLSSVRVHTDPQAAESARAVNAHAYTVGQHIVFDSGKYDPHSGSGQRLLAHELAHTVQQRNVRHTPDVLPLRETPEYNQLENEADSIAQSVMHRGASFTPRAASPMLSRAKNSSTTPPKPSAPATASNRRDVAPNDSATAESTPAVTGEKSERQWQPATTPALTRAKVKAWAVPQDQTGIVAVTMKEALNLPSGKGPVLDAWKSRAAAGALEAIVEPASGTVKTKAGLKQDRPAAESLQKIWLQKVGWLPQNANAKWKLAIGHAEAFPKINKATCNVDHIVELQFGGNNIPNNVQMLDGAENQASGRSIFQDLKKVAEEVKHALEDDKLAGKITDILIHYDDVVQESGYVCKVCCLAEEKAKTLPRDFDPSKGQSIDGKTTGTPYPLKAGGFNATFLADDEKAKAIDLAGSAIAENKRASTLISGFSLIKWIRPPDSKGGGTVESIMDTTSRFPVSLKPDKSKKIKLNRATDGTLKLPAGNENVKFHFDYLSEGVFNTLKLQDDGALVGSGTITPSIAFLPTFDVRFDAEKFELAKPIPKDKLKLPIPGVKIDKAEVLLQLAPEFKPAGEIEFSLTAGKRHLLNGKIGLSGDANGLVATGDVQVSLPGVDNAAGHIEYRNRQWSGKAEINASQRQSKLKYVKSGSLVVLFNDQGMSADGKVMLDVPGTKGVEAELLYESTGKRWIFKGKGAFKPPGFEEVVIEVTYDGEHIDGRAKTGFIFHGIHGDITVIYHDEKLSGEGKLAIDKGKAKGSLHVKMREHEGHPKFSGEGEISYQLTENLVATAGIIIDEQEHVRLKGALEFPKPIKLFDPVKGDYTFFDVGVSIPIPGASVGPVGLKARIDGSLSAGYQIGPGELRNTKLEAAFNPLDDKPDADVVLTSTLYIGAHAYIKGRIEGSIVLDAVAVSVSGGLAITATASLDGSVESSVKLHYQKSRFEGDADFKLAVGLALSLALDAFVQAKAGWGYLSVEKRKEWNLASYKYDTGMQFGMKLKKPLHYASDEPAKLPSLDDIEWIKPELKVGDILSKLFGSAGGTEKEVP